MSSKFNKELKELVSDQVISSEIADKISQYYGQKEGTKPNKLFTIFGIFGALLIGAGIILMLAHNWDDFSRLTKTILAFVPLVIGQSIVGFSILKNKSRTWKEASGTFLFFAVGASISLVSQIYNISGDLGSFLKTWTILCLPLIYLLRSHAVTLLVILSGTYYVAEVGIWNYRNYSVPWWYFIFMLGIIPHYWRQIKNNISSNTTTIFNWIIPLSVTIGLGAFIRGNEELGFVMYVTLFGVFYNIGRLSIFKELRTLRNGFLIIGSLGTIILLMIFTFKWTWKEMYDTTMYQAQEFYVSLFLVGIAISTLGYIVVKKGVRSINLFQISFLIFWGLFFLLSGAEVIPMILTNILVFALGITAIKIGTDKFNFGILNYGLLIVSILIICRFFDTDMSFIIKGLLFVIVGAGFFLTNYMMLKKQQKNSNL
ncbi:DUF2157 domain-containing protein [Aquimarina sp. AD1]|uniref:DUF2157 domain-containing protein n=1 Tax=Aquimarina sp. (strain AD1) TaxID=1714848 RepID=UPI000E4881BF|nr:DUF2157 domain-containing protein [Aquimarina sp. AD1]AXT56585.1 DUF2157 domain-containing protein [Aquimarina sp. AD1]RKN33811.1 DUF2157 domain-containing protein [Aquimarina sp. AD1]